MSVGAKRPRDDSVGTPGLISPGLDAHRIVPLHQLPFTFGRGDQVDLRIGGHSRISRVHGVISGGAGGGFELVDRSSNGIWANGERVDCTAPFALVSPCELFLGASTEGGGGVRLIFHLCIEDVNPSSPLAALGVNVAPAAVVDVGDDEPEVAGDGDDEPVAAGGEDDVGSEGEQGSEDSEEDDALRQFFMQSQRMQEEEDEDAEGVEVALAPLAGAPLATPAAELARDSASRPSERSRGSRGGRSDGKHARPPRRTPSPPPAASDSRPSRAAMTLLERLREPLADVDSPAPSAESGGGDAHKEGIEIRAEPPAEHTDDDEGDESGAAARRASMGSAASTSSGGHNPMLGFVPKARHAKATAAPGRSAAWLEGANGGNLAARYGAPPFSVLDARKGYWRERRRWWEDRYEINSDRGRKDNLIGYKGLGSDAAKGTSVFCPVLAELCYRWFCPAGGSVLDPFAGGSVRGCVAARTGLRYTGIDISRSQVDENRKQAVRMAALANKAGARWVAPKWVCADARELPQLSERIGSERVDFVFSCPPYYDLERYSDDQDDLSNAQSYTGFLQSYREIIQAALHRLEQDRFCCFVVGEIRDAEGFCRNFVGCVDGGSPTHRSAHASRYAEACRVRLPCLAGTPSRLFRSSQGCACTTTRS